MRKINIFFIFLISFLALISVNSISAEYNGEEVEDFNNYKVIAFLEDGTFIIPTGVSEVDILLVAGGAAGGCGQGGGGGAGGLKLIYNVSVTENVNIVVGTGGNGTLYNVAPNSGLNSSFGSYTVKGGGAGGWGDTYTCYVPTVGGSGGGGRGYCNPLQTGASGTSTQGYQGGDGASSGGVGHVGAGGGGGAGGPGTSATLDVGRSGGPGYNVSAYFGHSYGVNGYFAAGGGGSGSSTSTVFPGAGQGGVGGDGGDATDYTGSGGGGALKTYTSGDGGDGIVLIRYLEYTPQFITHLNSSTINNLQLSIFWDDVEVDYFELSYANNSSFDNNVTNIYEDVDYTLLYLENGSYYFNIRSYLEGEYTEWNNDVYGLYKLTKNDKPVFSSPEGNVSTAVVNFNWNDIGGITSYDIQVATDENFSNLVFDTNSSISEIELTFETDDDYFARVRGKDNYYVGEWSEILEFNLEISIIPFTFDFDLLNHYAGEQNFVCYFTGVETGVDYVFNINKLNADGSFNSLITSLTATGNEANESDFGYVFPTSANYPFSVTYPEGGNAELGRFYVQPVPSNFWTTAPHRTIIDPWQTGLAVGPVAYNSKSGQLMHDATKPTQSLYEQDEYIILNYQIPRPSVQNCSIIFKNIATLEEVLEIDGRDLYNYNGGVGYGEVNFIVIPLNGEIPDIVDYNVATDFNFVGDDWFTKTFSKGAYYYYIDLGDDNYTYGESNLLIGNDTDEEWTLDTDKDTYVNGKAITYTITYNTEEIWDAYKYTLLYDASSQEYVIGQSVGGGEYSTEVYPGAFVTSNTISDLVSNEYLNNGYSWIGFWPEAVTTTTNTGYEYYVTTTYLITEPTDVTEGLDDFLDSLGLGTSVGKLILAMGILIGSLIVLAVVGMPNIVLIISAVAIFIILVAVGLIPIWVAIILGIVLFLKAISGFSGGGGE